MKRGGGYDVGGGGGVKVIKGVVIGLPEGVVGLWWCSVWLRRSGDGGVRVVIVTNV